MPLEFARSARSTVGIEWEVALVDRNTGDLVSIADEVLDALCRPDGSAHPTITGELLLNTVELVSGVHDTVRHAVADRIRLRSGSTRPSPTRRATTSSSTAPSGGGAT